MQPHLPRACRLPEPQLDRLISIVRYISPDITERELVGICMQALRGRANPSLVIQLIREGYRVESCIECEEAAVDPNRAFCRVH